MSPPLCEVAEATGDSLLLLCRGSRGRERQSAGSKREGTDRAPLCLGPSTRKEERKRKGKKAIKRRREWRSVPRRTKLRKQNSEIDRSRAHFRFSFAFPLSLQRSARGEALFTHTARERESAHRILRLRFSLLAHSRALPQQQQRPRSLRAFFFFDGAKSNRRRRRHRLRRLSRLSSLAMAGPSILLEEPRHGPRGKPFRPPADRATQVRREEKKRRRRKRSGPFSCPCFPRHSEKSRCHRNPIHQNNSRPPPLPQLFLFERRVRGRASWSTTREGTPRRRSASSTTR